MRVADLLIWIVSKVFGNEDNPYEKPAAVEKRVQWLKDRPEREKRKQEQSHDLEHQPVTHSK